MTNHTSSAETTLSPGNHPRSHGASWLRRFALRSFALLLGAIAAGTLAEVGIRVLAPQPMSFGRFYAPGENVNWTLRPNHEEQITTGEYSIQVHIDWLGCRGNNHLAATPNDTTTTILILGDSYMFGNGVDDTETMAAQLEALLRHSPPNRANYRVVNASVPGYGPIQYRLRYETLRKRFRPSIAIIGLYVGNDIFDCSWDKSALSIVNGYLVSKEGASASALRFWIKRNSHLYRLLSRASQNVRARGGPTTKSYADTLIPLFEEQHAREDTEEGKVWSRFETEMEHLLQSARADGVTPFVVFLPMQLQVNDEMWNRYSANSFAGTGRPRRFLPQERIGTLLDRLDVGYIDLTPAIIANGGSRLFYALDGHWNPDGHRVAARPLAERLTQILADNVR